jgi:prepilin-type N-terminal cleavage/methylation domain-containing protein
VRRTRAAGFTLIEMMAVALLTAVVLAAAADFYIDLSTASRAAIERVRGERRAVAILDRVARDLESSVLVKKPADLDPLAHPWLFLAEGAGELGAERLMFVSRGRVPRVSALRESDLERVAYWLHEREDGSQELVRWSNPHLPESLDRNFPAGDDPGAAVLAEGVAAFGVRFLGEAGEWVPAWDSSQLVESSELPLAAEISIELLPEAEDGTPVEVDPAAEAEAEPRIVTRQVLLPLRPRDVEKELNPEAGEDQGDEGDDEDEDAEDGEGEDDGLAGEDGEACVTVAQCIALNQALFDSLEPETQQAIQGMGGLCFKDVSIGLPVVGCE